MHCRLFKYSSGGFSYDCGGCFNGLFVEYFVGVSQEGVSGTFVYGIRYFEGKRNPPFLFHELWKMIS